MSSESLSFDRPRRVAVIGYGLAGPIFHAPFIHATPGLELAAVVTRDPARKAQARADYPGIDVFETVDAIWTRQTDVDAVVIATPNRAHAPLAIDALRAGLAVVVDKPLAVSSVEARRVIDEARTRKGLLTVFQNRRWDGDFLTVRRLLGEGVLGDPLRFESRFERWRLEAKAGWRESPAPEDAGGLLVDLGSHLIDQALVLFGPVGAVYAELDVRRAGVAMDDDTFVALTHESGVRSHLWMSVLASQAGPRFRVLGRKASFVKFGLDLQEARLKAGERPGRPDWGEDPHDRWGHLGADGSVTPVQTEAGNYAGFYEAFARALHLGAPPPVDPADAVRVLEIIEAARDSASTGQLVHISQRG